MRTLALLLLILVSTMAAHAQGTINFINFVSIAGVNVVNAPVYESDGVTPLRGSQFMAELLVGPTADSLVSLAQTGFLFGAAGGYFNGGTVVAQNVNDFAYIQVRAWNTLAGFSFAEAQASGLPNAFGSAAIIHIMTGGGDPVGVPAPLVGLTSFSLNAIPEPTPLALLGCALAVVFLRKGLTTR